MKRYHDTNNNQCNSVLEALIRNIQIQLESRPMKLDNEEVNNLIQDSVIDTIIDNYYTNQRRITL